MQLNYILGFDATRRAVTMYEIEKQPISSSTKFENEQIKEILTFAETIKLNNEKTSQDDKTGIDIENRP